jgi:putative ABC transport system permease protein
VTTAAVTLPGRADGHGGAPRRRAILRWSLRLFRQDWRRQVLILALLTAAVAATTVGLAVITNVAELHADPTFGTANTIVSLSGSDPHLSADVAALQAHFGVSDVVGHRRLPIPGSVSTIDLRAQDPHGRYVGATVRLDDGRYPTHADEVAVTRSVASTFSVHVGGSWTVAGHTYAVVGTVENPRDLSDQFALVAPGHLAGATTVSVLANASASDVDSFRLPSGTGLDIQGRGTASKVAIEGTILAFATVGMLFVGLLAVAGFAVVAQRRMRALGVLSSVGATDRSVRLVLLANGAAVGLAAAVAGGFIGFVVWLALYRAVQSIVDHRIGPLDLPWFAVILGLVLAFVTSLIAAWWPARAAARVPIVAALSARPPKRQPAHRFAAAGLAVLAGGIVLLAFSDQRRAGFIIGGTIASVVGLLLLAPLAIQGVARLAAHAPISLRLALRDLARYQARSGAALGAATLAIAIAATIAISAAAAATRSPLGNLPADELVVYIGQKPLGPGSTVPVLDANQTAAVDSVVAQLAAALHTRSLPLQAPYDPSAPTQPPGQGPGDQLGGRNRISLAHIVAVPRGEEIDTYADLSVATPELLAQFGVTPNDVAAHAEIITSRTDLQRMSLFDAMKRGPSGTPSIEIVRQIPTYGSDPNVLITQYGLRAFGLAAMPSGWLFHTRSTLTAAQITAARRAAVSAGLVIETRSAPKSYAPLRNWSTAAGILVALGVLAMTVGLIRSEAGRDLRTLTATGASSRTRRAITASTTGALASLGAALGTAGAYAALTAWHRSDLHPLTRVPWINLAFIVVALPVLATACGWLLAGREPPAMNRQPLE